MKTKLHFSWKKAVRFDPEFARKLEVISRRHYEYCHDEILKEASLSVIDYPDFAAIAKVGDERTAKLPYGLVSSLSGINDISWSAKLSDESLIENLTTLQLLELPNNPRSRVIEATPRNNSHDYAFSVTFEESQFGSPVDVRVSGLISVVQRLRLDLDDLLSISVTVH